MRKRQKKLGTLKLETIKSKLKNTSDILINLIELAVIKRSLSYGD